MMLQTNQLHRAGIVPFPDRRSVLLWMAILAVGLTALAWIGVDPISRALAKVSNQNQELPKAPAYYVLDEAKLIDPPLLRALQTLLIEHDRQTGERLFVAIFKELGKEEPAHHTQAVFRRWKLDQAGSSGNAILLVLYWKEKKIGIRAGIGLEGVLSSEKTETIARRFLLPELEAGMPDRAVSLGALEILKTLESPLIHNGVAHELLRSGGLKGTWDPVSRQGVTLFWIGAWLSFLAGLALFAGVLLKVTAAEAHYSASGMSRPAPWDGLRRSRQRSNTETRLDGVHGSW